MCDIISPILLGVGAAVSAVSSVVVGQQQASAARLKAQMDSVGLMNRAAMERKQANVERIAGQYQARRQQEAAAQLRSKQMLAFASQGIVIDSGSPLDVMIDSETEASMDQAATEWNANRRAGQIRDQATINESNAKMALIGGRAQADALETAGWMGGIAAGASGIGKAMGGEGGKSLAKLGNSIFGM